MSLQAYILKRGISWNQLETTETSWGYFSLALQRVVIVSLSDSFKAKGSHMTFSEKYLLNLLKYKRTGLMVYNEWSI